jgi:hypothetical protein
MMRWHILPFLGVLLAPAVGSAATFDLSGEWDYTISGLQVTGPCPKGAGSSGKLEITQEGDSFTLVLLAGATCNPTSMCTYTGTVSGADYTASNSAQVDNEGGTVTNTLTFTATSPAAASGAGQSVYEHPDMSCTWTKDITLTREAPDGGVADDAGEPDGTGGISGPDGAVADGSVGAGKDDDDGGCSVARSASLTSLLFLLGVPLLLRLRRQYRRAGIRYQP